MSVQYIKETTRTIKTRVQKRDNRILLKHVIQSAVTEHRHLTSHSIDVNNAIVLASETRYPQNHRLVRIVIVFFLIQ